MLEIFEEFGEIKFGEENNMCASDFENSFRRHFFTKEKRPHGKYKWGEIVSVFANDFEKSLKNYFE
jgi:hypothetical protein